jgi:hypothetical protein
MFARSQKPEDDSAGKIATPFPEEKAIMSIYGRPAPNESSHRLKLTDRVIISVSMTVLEYLRWSESPMTFNRTEHRIASPS